MYAFVIELHSLLATRQLMTILLATIGVGIAFGPEIRTAVARLRRHTRAASEELPQGHVVAR